MHSGIVATLAAALLASAPSQGAAEDWSHYVNPRFAYAVDIPPGFSAVAEAENSDGGVSRRPDGKAELRVWGAFLVIGDFKSDVAGRVESDVSEGWTISYDRRTARNASWSGSKNSRVFYARAVQGCDDTAAYFRLEYDRSDMKIYNATIGRLVKSLHGTC